MNIADVAEVRSCLAGDRYSFLYSGRFPDDHSARLVHLAEALLGGPEGTRSARNRLAFVMVEAYQNIIRHGVLDGGGADAAPGMFLLRCRPDAQHVATVNAVRKEGVAPLAELLNRLGGMDLGQLKKLFLAGLQDRSSTHRRGAGLGLIEMARRSGVPLEHAFEHGAGEVDLFLLHVRSGSGSGADREALHKAARLHRVVRENRILLLQQGALPLAAQEVIMRTMEAELDGSDEEAVRRAYLAAMEFLGDGALHGTAPLIVLSGMAGDRVLTLALTLPAEEAARIDRRIGEITRAGRNELLRDYRSGLLERSRGAMNGDLGLLDLARHGRRPLVHRQLDLEGDGRSIVVQAAL